MPFIPTVGCVEVVMQYDNYGEVAYNVFHVKPDDPIDVALLNSIAASFKNWFDVSLSPAVTTGVSLERIKVTDVSTDSGAFVEYVTGLPIAGEIATGYMPQNVTAAVKLASGLVGRSQRGRTYIVGVSFAATDGTGHLGPSAITGFTEIYQDLIDAMAANAWPLVILSKFHNNAPRLAGQMTEVLTASVNSALDSQRRRLPERGI